MIDEVSFSSLYFSLEFNRSNESKLWLDEDAVLAVLKADSETISFVFTKGKLLVKTSSGNVAILSRKWSMIYHHFNLYHLDGLHVDFAIY